MNKQIIVSLLAMMSFASCSVISYVPVQYEVLLPAYYTMPYNIDSIVVVNGLYDFKYNDVTLTVADTALKVKQEKFLKRITSLVCNVVRDGMEKSGYISAKMDLRIMSPLYVEMKVDSLCRAHGVDAVMVLSDANYKALAKYNPYDVNLLKTILDCKFDIYTSRGKKISLEQVKDSIIWPCYDEYGLVEFPLPDYKEVYFYTAQKVGEKVVDQLCPGWSVKNRNILVTNERAFMDAAQWLKQGEWEQAKNLWIKEYGNDNMKNRIIASINMAMYNEYMDNVEDAIKWSCEAMDLIDANPKIKMKEERAIANSIFKDLMIRKQELDILSKQMRNK